MPLSNVRELKEDILFRASEPLLGSPWNTKAIDYLNRVYRTLCSGASEFLPEYVDDWWWMRASSTLMLEPMYNTGLVTVTQGSVTATLDHNPTINLTGRRLRIVGQDIPDIFIIASHTAGTPTLILDAAYTGPDATGIQFEIYKVNYDLSQSVQVLISPIVAYQAPLRISGLTPERMDELFPLANLRSGFPQAFSLDNERAIRFSHGGRVDGRQMRVEYRYRPIVADLTDSISSIPLVPAQWMHILADMALVYVLLDKNDDRSNAVALGARTGLAGMLKENRRRLVKIDFKAGHIHPRPSPQPWLVTESGLIIG